MDWCRVLMEVLVPVNMVIAKIMKNLQKRQMKNKDARTRLMTEARFLQIN